MFALSATRFALRRLPTSSGALLVSSSASAFVGVVAAAKRFHGSDEEHGHEPTGDRTRPIKTRWTFADGTRREIPCFEGQTLLEVAQEHQLPIEGACAGSCACSTCHVYLKEEDYDKFEEPSDEENDMLDLAFYPQATSRLGCQIKLTKAVDGLEVELPKATRNMAVDGYVATPH